MADSFTPSDSFVFDLYRQMKKYTLSYIYRGDFSADLSNKILSLAENNMEHNSEPNSLKKKVYFIMVESLQNITRHQTLPNKEDLDKSSFFVIQRLEKEYYITSGNIVENSKIESLKTNLNKINSLDKENLKEYYKKVITQGEFSAKGGAGLGFIEMARKSGHKLAYDFKQIDEQFSHFYFQTTISLPESEHLPEADKEIEDARLVWLENVDKQIVEKNLNLIYQVDFTQESLIGILAMAEGNIGSSQELILRKKVFNTIIELLQNIYKHADDPDTNKEGKSGIFLLGEKNGEYVLTTGNLILNSRVESVVKKLEQVNNSSLEELDTLYNETMMSDDKVGQKGAGLGFIDIKLKTSRNLTYNFTKVDNEYSFFEIQIKLA
ncbi:MAG: SiaB family protein kinase [Bacteroidia bacterium]